MPSGIRQRNGDTDQPSKRTGNVDSPQDRGSEPSKRVDRKNGKKGYGNNGDGNDGDGKKEKTPDLKHHPLPREPPRGRNSSDYSLAGKE